MLILSISIKVQLFVLYKNLFIRMNISSILHFSFFYLLNLVNLVFILMFSKIQFSHDFLFLRLQSYFLEVHHYFLFQFAKIILFLHTKILPLHFHLFLHQSQSIYEQHEFLQIQQLSLFILLFLQPFQIYFQLNISLHLQQHVIKFPLAIRPNQRMFHPLLYHMLKIHNELLYKKFL